MLPGRRRRSSGYSADAYGPRFVVTVEDQQGHFHDLEEGLAGVAPNTLSARLKTLEKQGVIAARLYEQHPPRFEYFLTDKGQALGPVLKALYKWGERYG